VESGLDEYAVEGQAIRRFSSPFEQIDRMLAWLEARRITFEPAREIAQAEFDVSGIDPRSGMELDPAERSALGHVGSLRVGSSTPRTFQR
jgi:hypothetical protein